ncbi:15-hydroxyprostaglandin dehydrogenase [NAD(+)]-like [Ischnura elegans]|uniref:15-hydroxyprostaglandin dehydrogenase [NAD(+)]-like n=1 Tax=Ischnura elegans TaxID=197161 RepID=UPI001ED8BFB7|nr:15-hydroxyprostaglandin dehydrogenase [NAD(+)]-like [Ischnura elegans]
MDPSGKVALVTGGAVGIGRMYCKELLKAGAKVFIFDINETEGDKCQKEFGEEFGEDHVFFLKGDVTSKEQLEGAFKQAMEKFKGLDIVVNNAGVMNDGLWEKEIAINVTAVCRGTILAMQHMGKDQGGNGGLVVNIASILGLRQFAGCPVYAATKHAVIGLSRSYAEPFHYNNTGVRVVTICPGVTDTDLISGAGGRQMSNNMGDHCAAELNALPKQPVDFVAKAFIHLVREGHNGVIVVQEGGEPFYEVNIPHYSELKSK